MKFYGYIMRQQYNSITDGKKIKPETETENRNRRGKDQVLSSLCVPDD